MWTALRLGFTTWKGFLKILPYILVVGVVLYFGHKTYVWIDNNGASRVQAQWDKETGDYQRVISNLRENLRVKEENHIRTTAAISNQLEQEKQNHEEAIATLAADYDQRLRNSEARASVYQRQAQGGTASCISLASHATELDKSLEEGRSLVKEFRSTLGLRDRQLTLVGQQLLADRKLFTDQEAGN